MFLSLKVASFHFVFYSFYSL
uniref:Uncharacterized protein n=1 Tax=Rhizophora mucronata TaxID=61149 RepID=A0A2P2K6M4_RHIMU